jgi:hypothetical protein
MSIVFPPLGAALLAAALLAVLLLLLLLPQAASPTTTAPASIHPVRALPRVRMLLLLV